MAARQTGAKVYRSMQGKVIDLDKLRQRNELTPAVGNVRMNARGDELGPGGKISRSKEEIMKDYYKNSDNVVKEQEYVTESTVESEPVKPARTSKTTNRNSRKKDPVEITKQDEQEEWIEDENGNFVKRNSDGN